jgi:regulatory protein
MRVTNLSLQVKNPNRVNISLDGKYKLSLDIVQVTELGIKVGRELTEDDLSKLEGESEFGKLYARALEYCLVRPRSRRELNDYLYRKMRSTRLRNRRTGELYDKPGVSRESSDRVIERLSERGYVDDEKFARYWLENRNQRKGSSLKKLKVELQSKGVDSEIIDRVILESERNDGDELKKVIAKKQRRYSDRDKFIKYLMTQGFRYDEIRQELDDD